VAGYVFNISDGEVEVALASMVYNPQELTRLLGLGALVCLLVGLTVWLAIETRKLKAMKAMDREKELMSLDDEKDEETPSDSQGDE